MTRPGSFVGNRGFFILPKITHMGNVSDRSRLNYVYLLSHLPIDFNQYCANIIDMEGKQIRELRKLLGLSQGGLAKKLGTNKETISRWENGHAKPRMMAQKLLQELRESLC